MQLTLSFSVQYYIHLHTAKWLKKKKLRRQLHKNAASNIEQVLEATPNKAAAVRPPTTHHENYPR